MYHRDHPGNRYNYDPKELRYLSRQQAGSSYDRTYLLYCPDIFWLKKSFEKLIESYHAYLFFGIGRSSDLRIVIIFPLARWAGYHFSNHTVNTPISAGTILFMICTHISNPEFRRNHVQKAVRTYRIPQHAARI